MSNSYLEVFNNLFYNVDDKKEIKNIIVKATHVLDLLITKFGEIVNEIATGTSHKDAFVDIVIVLFIRKIMEQLDAINVLYSVCLFDSAELILRSLIENIVSLEFILKEDTKKRAAAYSLEYHFQELEIAEKYLNENSELAKQIIVNKGRAEFDKDCEKIEKKKQALKHFIESEEIFQTICEARKMKLCTKKRGKKHIQWYEVCSDIKNFYGLMKEVDKEKYYDGIYGALSLESHGLNATTKMKIKDNGINLKRIRSPEGGGSSFALACGFSIGVLKKIYQYLGDGENEKAEFNEFFKSFVKERDIVLQYLDDIQSADNNEA